MLCSIPIVILNLYIHPYQNLLVTKLRALSLVSTMLKIEYAMQYTYSFTLCIHIPTLRPINVGSSGHCLWFLLCSIPIVILYLYIYPYQNLLVMKLRALSLVSTMLKIEYAMQYTYSFTLRTHIPILRPINVGSSEHCLWFLLCSKSSMLCSIPIALLYVHIYQY